MSKELIIDVRPSDINIALLEDKQLVEVHQERNDVSYSVGNIYLGRVKKVMPGLNAAFVDIGYEKDAFLHYLDMGPQFRSLQKFLQTCLSQKGQLPSIQKFRSEPDIDKRGKISDLLTNGQLIVVQVVKEPISTKGPRLSSEISFAGRNMVLMPFHDKISISQKINSGEERDRLHKMLQGIRTRNLGIIVRTAAVSQKVATLDSELRDLTRRFEQTFTNLHQGKVPRLLSGEINRTSSLLRDILNASFTSICVNDPSVYEDIREYIGNIAPDKQNIIKLYQDQNVSIFESFGVEKSIKALFGKTISIKAGSYLIIEHTEAFHVIDVNSGKKSKTSVDQETTGLEANLAAVTEIARQLRLRDMGGIIVIDFIDMVKNDHRQKVFDKMKEAMATDRAKHNILPLSKFGLMQITRQRVRPEMNIDTLEKCPACNGSGEISPSILLIDEIESRLSSVVQNSEGPITIKVHPYIEAYIRKGFFSQRFKWRMKFHRKIRISTSMSMHLTGYRFYDQKNQELKYN